MDFNIDFDFQIFNELLKKRPEISTENLKKDLQSFFLPYVEKLLKLKEGSPDKGLVVGVSAIQGAGKTTQGEILEILLKHFKKSSVSLSIDDHYLTHKELCALREKDLRFIRRGVTHDINLAIKEIKELVDFGEKPVLVAGYDKGAQEGDGDRFAWLNPVEDLKIVAQIEESDLVVNKQNVRTSALRIVSANFAYSDLELPENMGSPIPLENGPFPDELVKFLNSAGNHQITILGKDSGAVYFINSEAEIAVDKKELPKGWRVVSEKPDIIFYDGWMLGARKVEDESIFSSGLPALEKPEDQEFAKFINNKLTEYEPLWDLIDFMNVLYVANYQMSLQWRDQAEEALRAKGEGMTHDQIIEFVHYFWRSVHPAIQIKALAMDSKTDQVVVINDDHSIKEVLKPEEVKQKYP